MKDLGIKDERGSTGKISLRISIISQSLSRAEQGNEPLVFHKYLNSRYLLSSGHEIMFSFSTVLCT